MTTYGYDAQNVLTRITVDNDNDGNLSSVQEYNCWQDVELESYDYDDDGNTDYEVEILEVDGSVLSDEETVCSS